MGFHLLENISKITERAERIRAQSASTAKKTLIATIVMSTISIHTSFAAANDMNKVTKLKTIYHVYVNDHYLGAVSDKNRVEAFINEKMEKIKEKYKGFDFTYKTDEVAFVPEQIFRNTAVENEEVLSEIDKEYQIQVEAVALKIDGKIVSYLENLEKVDEAIEKLKLQYVSKEDLEKIEKLKNAKGPLPALKKVESRLLDVKLSRNVTVSLEKVKPEQVLSVDDTVKLLQKGTLEERKYTVQEGDVLGTIAEKHGLKLKQLLELNPGIKEDTLLQIGDQLNVTVKKPYLDVVVEKEVYAEEKIPYERKVIEDSSMYKGDTKVVQEGSEGKRAVTYVVSERNGREIARKEKGEKILKQPVAYIVRKGTKVIPSRGTGNFAWPTNGGYISSHVGYRWGQFHKGIDIARPYDRIIRAADNGVVVSAGWDGGYGNKIVIDHRNGFRTVYAHLASINVRVGQTVARGAKIGVMGSTGDSTGVHLHFEVYKNGALQNPLNYLR